MANNGWNPRMGFELRKRGKVVKAEKFVKRIKEIQEEVQEEMKKQVDQHRRELEEYKIGDMVLLST